MRARRRPARTGSPQRRAFECRACIWHWFSIFGVLRGWAEVGNNGLGNQSRCVVYVSQQVTAVQARKRKGFPLGTAWSNERDTGVQQDFLLFVPGSGTPQKTRPPSSDKTCLLTWDGLAGDGGSLSDMLMVTTTVGMVDGVLCDAAGARPRVRFDSVFMVCAPGLEHGLVDAAAAGDDADHGAGKGGDDFFRARGQLQPRLALVGVVADDDGVVAGGAREHAAVPRLLFDVGDDRALGHGREGEDVADGQRGLASRVDELAREHAFVGNEGLAPQPVLVRVAEDDLCERRAAAGVVDDLLYHAANVPVLLGVVVCPVLGRRLAEPGRRLEDAAFAFSLRKDDSTHLWLSVVVVSLMDVVVVVTVSI